MSRKDNEVNRVRARQKAKKMKMEHSTTIRCLVEAMNSFNKQVNNKSLPLPQRQEAKVAAEKCKIKIESRRKDIEELDKQWS